MMGQEAEVNKQRNGLLLSLMQKDLYFSFLKDTGLAEDGRQRREEQERVH